MTECQKPIFVHGYGSVSAAGTSAAELYDACAQQKNLGTGSLERTTGEQNFSYNVRPVDMVALKKVAPKHARLRRASKITKFAVTAAFQALGEERMERIRSGELRLGIVVSFFNGCVDYSNRFYTEVLEEPAFASPILFPETVFNAPAGHIASYLGSDGPAYTLIGDASTWFSAIRVANDWLNQDQVDGCLVICAEELDWLTSEALTYYSPDLVATEGGSAVYLENNPSEIKLERLLGPFDYTSTEERKVAISDSIGIINSEAVDSANIILVDGLTQARNLDKDEHSALQAWESDRMSPLSTLGFGMGASCGFQTIAALEALKQGYENSIVIASGSNQHAFSTLFTSIKNE
ncbi:beta-ketoacyl synthase N-terminal-like domain-containing protein [Rubritalea sp.]|uniref:beta-ketoacyl synthase N-terminal-like domain-containing protein n=1 Tax=Rubritalea sp. TaxID=2109375 RepID=UPI003EF2BA69